jgi:hypothetical protein
MSFIVNEWVLVQLDKLSKDMRDKTMFIWWRECHHRNTIIFGDGKVSIQNSIIFLQNYLATLQNMKKGDVIVEKKRKNKRPAIYRREDTKSGTRAKGSLEKTT